MDWGLIIGGLISMFGPALADLIKQLLDKWFARAAARLPAPTVAGADVTAQQLVLIDATLKVLPFVAFGRRALLKRMRALVVAGGTPSADDVDEVTGLAVMADQE